MSNSATDPDSDLRFAIQPYHPPLYDVVPNPNPNDAAAATSSRLVPTNNNANNNNPRKKRTKVIRPDSNPKSPPRMAAVKREKGPEITMPCSECGKRFWSWKALFGHMRCHPERQWRGINPPPSLLRHRRLGGTTTLSPPPMMMPFSADENDVAACLLLLANAGGPPKPSADNDADGGDDGDIIVDRFECSSCKKVFGSHQALGGHRASHKNVKGCFAMAAEDHQNGAVSDAEKRMIVAAASTEPFFGFSSHQQQHQCGICLRIFSSGQALGGHKRCHWERGSFEYDAVHPLSVITTTSSTSRALDLNLPPRMEEKEEEEEDDDDRDRCCYYSSTSNMALDLRLGL